MGYGKLYLLGSQNHIYSTQKLSLSDFNCCFFGATFKSGRGEPKVGVIAEKFLYFHALTFED